jgi:hypothetical protein
VDAAATQDFRAHLLAVVADQASAVVAIGGSDRSAVVSSADDLVVLDDDGADGFLQAGCPLF